MTNEQKQVKDWMQKFGQECPEKPTIPSLEVRKLRAKLILEEALETIILGLGIGELTSCDNENYDFGWMLETLRHPKSELEPSPNEPYLIAIADGCSDLKVVTEGTLIACGLVVEEGSDPQHPVSYHAKNRDPLFNEVMRSNESKMWDFEEIIYSLGYNPGGLQSFSLGWSETDDKGITYTYVDENVNQCWLVKDSSGKVVKSPSYSPANLQPIIEEMSK